MGKFLLKIDGNDDENVKNEKENLPKIFCEECKCICSTEESSSKHENHHKRSLFEVSANLNKEQKYLSKEEQIDILLSNCTLVDKEIDKRNINYLKFCESISHVEKEITEWSNGIKDLIDDEVSILLKSLQALTHSPDIQNTNLYRVKENLEQEVNDVFNDDSFEKRNKKCFSHLKIEDIIQKYEPFPQIIFNKAKNKKVLVEALVGSIEIEKKMCHAEFLTSIDVGFPVAAMATKHNGLFVLGCGDSSITVYDDINFKYLFRFPVKNLSDPYDIEIIGWKSYITESETNKMHVVDLLEETSQEISVGEPFSTLSTTNRNNILATGFRHELVEYFPTGLIYRRIILPSNLNHIYKFMPLEDNRYVGVQEGNQHRVCLIDNLGNLLSCHKNSDLSSSCPKLNGACYMVMDDKKMYVCDHENKRIVIFNSDLRYVGDFDVVERPFRLCVDNLTRRLYVSYIGTNKIGVYKLK